MLRYLTQYPRYRKQRRSAGTPTKDVVEAAIAERRVTLGVQSDSDPQVEIWDASRKTELLEEVFGLIVELEWAPRPVLSSRA